MSTSSSSDGYEYGNWLHYVADSNFGIPEECPCGSAIIVQICTEAASIPKKFFVCKDFKVSCNLAYNCPCSFPRFKCPFKSYFQDDGLHRKQEWTTAIEDETRRLKKTVEEHDSSLRSLGAHDYRVQRIAQDVERNDANIAYRGFEIHEIEKVLKQHAEEIAYLKGIIEKL